MNMKNKKAIVLLSGGLDSYVALDIVKNKYVGFMAINFNYGQKAFLEENEAAKNIAQTYGIKLKTIDLSFLEELCNNALTDKDNFETDDFSQVWIPNRNGLFINIAGCFCDKYGIDDIVLGLNIEEAQKFSDNSLDFIDSVNKSLFYSTQEHPKVVAPCSKMNKAEMINYAIDNNLRFDLIKSCYDNINSTDKKHCGKCMSCKLLYNAVMVSKKPELIKELFSEDVIY